ncbi:MAG: gamma-glutamyltransferase [Chloroflexi bacterium]|nr:gamma-glutamyltransferase [Chloroflexota bacterium]
MNHHNTYPVGRSPHGRKSDSYIPPRLGLSGAVVANHPLAAMAGMTVLQKGGNAVDAAVAIGFALGVVEPSGSGIGGDGYVMVYNKEKGTVEVANGTGAAPLAATRERFLSDGIPMKGILSVSVPGILDALLLAHGKYGKLNLAECVEPAIALCEHGVPLSHRQADLIAQEKLLTTFPTSAAVWAPKGRPLRAGEVAYQPNLAKSYKLIADGGREVFYNGPIGRSIVRFSDEQGGLLTTHDFSRHKTSWQPPIHIRYRGHTVYEAPPNSSGHVLLQELNLVELFDLKSMGFGAADTIHIMVEAKKLAFADREAYLADPDYVDVPVEGLLSKPYAKDRAKSIDVNKAATNVREGDPWSFQMSAPDRRKRFRRAWSKVTERVSGTTHFCVVDRSGNAVSELQSLQTSFGSNLIAGTTGILLNNRMTYWHLEEGHIDVLRPGQRVRHTMNPVMVFSGAADRDGRLEIVCGTPGGDTQVQTNLQMVTGIIDFGLTPSEAVEANRWTHLQNPTLSTYPHTTHEALQIEERADPAVIERLKTKGYAIEQLSAWGGSGSAGMIQVLRESGALVAAADPRRDGVALVW